MIILHKNNSTNQPLTYNLTKESLKLLLELSSLQKPESVLESRRPIKHEIPLKFLGFPDLEDRAVEAPDPFELPASLIPCFDVKVHLFFFYFEFYVVGVQGR